ncbi:hypothetical protein C8R45DRAFT_1181007 [Mycena sanguinolenta]|nr:hypothetical protein C8R45DRAFT_1181007 [Mycena sanguinolenta]
MSRVASRRVDLGCYQDLPSNSEPFSSQTNSNQLAVKRYLSALQGQGLWPAGVMPICTDCSTDFYSLEEPACNKCVALKEAAQIDEAAIRVRIFSLENKHHRNACHARYVMLNFRIRCVTVAVICWVTYIFRNIFKAAVLTLCPAQADSIPRIVLNIPGATEQITIYQTSDFTSEIWGLAQGYKRMASDTRLGLPRALNTSLQKTPAGMTSMSKKLLQTKALERAVPGIGKGMTPVQEMKDARDQGTKIKITVTFAIAHVDKKAVVVPSVRVVHNAQEDQQTFDVLCNIILLVQDTYGKEHPEAKPINRSMVTFYAIETTTKYFNIDPNYLARGTISDLLRHFYEQRHISKVLFEAKKIEMRLVVKHNDLFPDPAFDNRFSSSSRTSRRTSIRESSRSTLFSPGVASEERESRARSTVRQSAWRRPAPVSQFSRNPPAFIEYKFTRFTVHAVGVDISISMDKDAPTERILVASDWKQGLALASDPQAKNTAGEIYKTGFIGQGSSKNVIYARIGSEEYALGQSRDINLPPSENARMLREEIMNMYLGDAIREEFTTIALECEVNVPEFRFNVEGAILGVLEPLEPGHISASLGLPFMNFIATRYLPCSAIDKGIQKFTGNTDCGDPPEDAMTAAVHAFTHFTISYTGSAFVFCDLQGLADRQGTMMLIDPQSHSSEPDSNKRMYWDGGPDAIQHFLDHHLESCGDNYICRTIAMKELVFEWGQPTTPTSDSQSSRARSLSVTGSPQRKRQRTSQAPLLQSPPRYNNGPLRIGNLLNEPTVRQQHTSEVEGAGTRVQSAGSVVEYSRRIQHAGNPPIEGAARREGNFDGFPLRATADGSLFASAGVHMQRHKWQITRSRGCRGTGFGLCKQASDGDIIKPKDKKEKWSKLTDFPAGQEAVAGHGGSDTLVAESWGDVKDG